MQIQYSFEELGLGTLPLRHLGTIVRAADTGRLELSPVARPSRGFLRPFPNVF